MENNPNPSPIKEYYIAYFDILGYRQFFKELTENDQQEKTEALLSEIHDAIDNTKRRLSSIRNNKLLEVIENADLDFKVKIFSDNFLFCLERHNEAKLEKSRALMFLEAISEIQRNFILVHNLFVRGGVTIGNISFNNDYIFGQGLIDVVEMEEKTVYPRIAISKPFYDFITIPISYTPEELEKVVNIGRKLDNGEEVSKEDNDVCSQLLSRILPEAHLMRVFRNMVYLSGDGMQCISYLYKINPNDYMDSKSISDILAVAKRFFPDVADELSRLTSNTLNEIGEMLRIHKIRVENQIRKHGNYNDIKLNNPNEAIQRERILKKYAWAMKYHNDMFNKFFGNNYFIHSIANCDPRFMTLMINIVDPAQSTFYNAHNDQNGTKNNE